MKKINWQIFISFNLLFSFLLMLLSGIVLYFKPEGSVARWLDWKFLFFTKSAWESLHTVFSFLFMIFALLHILKVHLLNFFIYLNQKHHFAYKELLFAIVITLIVLVGTSLKINPFQSVYEFGNKLSESWKESYSGPDDEISASSSLKEIASFHQVSDSLLVQKLSETGFLNVKSHYSLKNIASRNNMSPGQLYDKIKGIKGTLPKELASPADHITVAEIAFILQVEPAKILSFIDKEWGINNIDRDSNLTDICNAANLTCLELRNRLYEYKTKDQNARAQALR
jgi:predicted DNA-binding ribbon-helix-helix protein